MRRVLENCCCCVHSRVGADGSAERQYLLCPRCSQRPRSLPRLSWGLPPSTDEASLVLLFCLLGVTSVFSAWLDYTILPLVSATEGDASVDFSALLLQECRSHSSWACSATSSAMAWLDAYRRMGSLSQAQIITSKTSQSLEWKSVLCQAWHQQNQNVIG